MRVDAIVISVLYEHFLRMKNRGRKVIPRFQTASVLSFALVIVLVLLWLTISEVSHGGNFLIPVTESFFLLGFISLIVAFFHLIQRYYFKTNKHIEYVYQLNALGEKLHKRYRVVTLFLFITIPFVLFTYIISI